MVPDAELTPTPHCVYMPIAIQNIPQFAVAALNAHTNDAKVVLLMFQVAGVLALSVLVIHTTLPHTPIT